MGDVGDKTLGDRFVRLAAQARLDDALRLNAELQAEVERLRADLKARVCAEMESGDDG